MSNLEEKIKQLEKTISHKDIPTEDKQKLLVEIKGLRQVLQEKERK